jgi:putative oxidoreductase
MFRSIEPHLYSVMRAVFGFLFLCHGLQKFGMLGGTQVDLMTLRGLAGIIETIGGSLIMAGLLTSPIAFICSGEMAVAYYMAHLPRSFWPIQNGGEPAVLFCFGFLYMAARGSGPLSLDAIARRKGVR